MIYYHQNDCAYANMSVLVVMIPAFSIYKSLLSASVNNE